MAATTRQDRVEDNAIGLLPVVVKVICNIRQLRLPCVAELRSAVVREGGLGLGGEPAEVDEGIFETIENAAAPFRGESAEMESKLTHRDE